MNCVDLRQQDVRELNRQLHREQAGSWRVLSPQGRHAIAAGLQAPLQVEVEGHTGYYCAGMNQHAEVTIHGNVGPGVAENMMSGTVRVKGNASQYAGASAHGGLLIIEGDASLRCGISLKGADVVVGGSIGAMGAFMAQLGTLVVCGDAGLHLGDSIYEAQVFVRGEVAGLGADCVAKPMREQHLAGLRALLARAGLEQHDPAGFRRYGSARRLYHFNVDHADHY